MQISNLYIDFDSPDVVPTINSHWLKMKATHAHKAEIFQVAVFLFYNAIKKMQLTEQWR